MLRLTIAGPHTAITSTLCAACPYSPAGCCTAPPRVDLSDVGRIVALGGRDWILAELAAKRLERTAGPWLVFRREKRIPRPGAATTKTCVYHGPTGCTIPQERRAATCNYYVCEDALNDGAAEGKRSRDVHARLVASYTQWDAMLHARVTAEWPDGPRFDDPAFLDWLGAAFVEVTNGAPFR